MNTFSEKNEKARPAAFRRLCVETEWQEGADISDQASRLRAAVC